MAFAAFGAQDSYAQAYQFTTIDYPGAEWTSASGINNTGDIVGTYFDGVNSHGFIYDGSTFVDIDYPTQGLGSTYLFDINDSGKITGGYGDGTLYNHFILENNLFTSFSFAGVTETSIIGLNDAGTVAGGYYEWLTNASNGFLYSNGIFAIYPSTVIFSDVNDNGQIIGFDPDGYVSYMFDPITLTMSYINLPYPTDIWAYAINDAGLVAGYAGDGGFVYDGTGYEIVNYPGSDWSSIEGINDNGYLVGYYTSGEHTHGFLATPITTTSTLPPARVPEPSMLTLFGRVSCRSLCMEQAQETG